MAKTVRDPGADQLLADVCLQHGGAERARQIGHDRGEAVVEVRVNQDLDRLRRDQAERRDRRFGRCDIVVPTRQAEREVLAQVADGRGTRGQGALRVFDRGRKAEHEIAEMRRDRRRGAQAGEILGPFEDHARAAHSLLAPRTRIPHGPVEAQAIAVDPRPGVLAAPIDLAIGAPVLFRIAVADLGVAHDSSGGSLRALVGRLRGLANSLQEFRGSDPPGFRQGPPGPEQILRRGQLAFRDHRAAFELSHGRSSTVGLRSTMIAPHEG